MSLLFTFLDNSRDNLYMKPYIFNFSKKTCLTKDFFYPVPC